MRGLSDDQLFRNEKDDALWSQEETDLFLNWYFQDTGNIQIARKLKRDEWSPRMRLHHIHYTPFDKWIQAYRPGPIRENREGDRFASKDAKMLMFHYKKGVSAEVTARFLMRPVDEVLGAYVILHKAGLCEKIKGDAGDKEKTEVLLTKIVRALETPKTTTPAPSPVIEDDVWDDEEGDDEPESFEVKLTLEALGEKVHMSVKGANQFDALESGLLALKRTLQRMKAEVRRLEEQA